MWISAESYEDVIELVRDFNQGLSEGKGLDGRLPFFRAWYYIPELDMVGPSKFMYKGITASEYMKFSTTELDGRETEPILRRWFDSLLAGTPEANYVENLVEKLVKQYNKTINRVARFNAPRGWRLGQGRVITPRTMVRENKPTEEHPMVDVVWRGFLTLSPEDQNILAERVGEHSRRKQ